MNRVGKSFGPNRTLIELQDAYNGHGITEDFYNYLKYNQSIKRYKKSQDLSYLESDRDASADPVIFETIS